MSKNDLPVVIVGGGIAGIILALKLVQTKKQVVIYEKTSSLGKKFLVAGKSDLNITHSEENMHDKFFSHTNIFKELFLEHSNQDFIHWLNEQGIETFVGTSGRVYPKELKASKILNSWVRLLRESQFCHIHLNSELTKISENSIQINNSENVHFSKVVYCLGGASWARTGSDGQWSDLFRAYDIKINSFKASNNSILFQHSEFFLSKYKYKPFKNIKVSCEHYSVQGDVLVTEAGFEGTPIYSLSNPLRKNKTLLVNFKPDLDEKKLKEKINNRDKKKSLSSFMTKNLNLQKIVYTFFRERFSNEEISDNLYELITKFTIESNGPGEIDKAISTIGGIDFTEINNNFELVRLPNQFVIGEMIDFDTITGGYLIQSCFSMASRIFINLKTHSIT